MPRDERRPIRYTRHAAERLEQRGIARAMVERAIRAGAWLPSHGGRWVTRVHLGEHGSTIDVVFVETTEISGDSKAKRIIEVLLVVTVIDVGRYRR